MAGAVQKTKAEECTDRINEIGQSIMRGEKLDEWAWRLLLKDLEALEGMPEHAQHSLRAQAVMWSFKEKNGQVDKLFGKYVGLYGKDWDWHLVRALTGPRLCRLDMVTDMLNFGYPKTDARTVINVAEICYQAGLFTSAYEAVMVLVSLGVENIQQHIKANLRHLFGAAKYLQDQGLAEIEVALRIQAGSKVVSEALGGLRNFLVIANDYGITFEYSSDLPIEDLVDIDMKVSAVLADQFEDTLSQHISIGVTPMEEGSQNAN